MRQCFMKLKCKKSTDNRYYLGLERILNVFSVFNTIVDAIHSGDNRKSQCRMLLAHSIILTIYAKNLEWKLKPFTVSSVVMTVRLHHILCARRHFVHRRSQTRSSDPHQLFVALYSFVKSATADLWAGPLHNSMSSWPARCVVSVDGLVVGPSASLKLTDCRPNDPRATPLYWVGKRRYRLHAVWRQYNSCMDGLIEWPSRLKQAIKASCPHSLTHTHVRAHALSRQSDSGQPIRSTYASYRRQRDNALFDKTIQFSPAFVETGTTWLVN